MFGQAQPVPAPPRPDEGAEGVNRPELQHPSYDLERRYVPHPSTGKRSELTPLVRLDVAVQGSFL
jgi:hypothetical protein